MGLVPGWLATLITLSFRQECPDHPKHIKNRLCTDCLHRACEHCQRERHSNHRVLQVRKYVYEDVILRNDISQLVDVSGIQPYLINRARAFFLKSREPSSRRGESACKSCTRALQEPYVFCSLGCKVADFIDSKLEPGKSNPFKLNSILEEEMNESDESTESETEAPPPEFKGKAPRKPRSTRGTRSVQAGISLAEELSEKLEIDSKEKQGSSNAVAPASDTRPPVRKQKRPTRSTMF